MLAKCLIKVAVEVVLNSIGPGLNSMYTVYVSSISYFSKPFLLIICELVEKSLDLEAGELGSSPSVLFNSCVS